MTPDATPGDEGGDRELHRRETRRTPRSPPLTVAVIVLGD